MTRSISQSPKIRRIHEVYVEYSKHTPRTKFLGYLSLILTTLTRRFSCLPELQLMDQGSGFRRTFELFAGDHGNAMIDATIVCAHQFTAGTIPRQMANVWASARPNT
jgi:hypothetical protein